jgi:hypothetical protein
VHEEPNNVCHTTYTYANRLQSFSIQNHLPRVHLPICTPIILGSLDLCGVADVLQNETDRGLHRDSVVGEKLVIPTQMSGGLLTELGCDWTRTDSSAEFKHR